MTLTNDVTPLLRERSHPDPATQDLLRRKYGREIPKGAEPQVLFRLVDETHYRLGRLEWYAERSNFAEVPYFRIVGDATHCHFCNDNPLVVYSRQAAEKLAEWYVVPALATDNLPPESGL